MRKYLAAAFALSTVFLCAQAAAAQTPEVRVLASNGIKAVVEDMLPQSERAIGHRISVEYRPTANLKQEIDAGAPFDVVIVTVESIAQTKQLYETTDLRSKLARYHADVDSAFYGWNDIWLNPAFREWRIVDELAAIKQPLLAVQGHDDNYGTMAQIDTIGKRVPHARLVKLDACGHSPHRDAPDALNEVIAAFISRQR